MATRRATTSALDTARTNQFDTADPRGAYHSAGAAAGISPNDFDVLSMAGLRLSANRKAATIA